MAYQEIEISRSVSLIYPSAEPVSGWFAEVIREDGEYREFSEKSPGFDKLRPVPEIDSIYYAQAYRHSANISPDFW